MNEAVVVSCGADTTLDSSSAQCRCDEEVSTAAILAECESKMNMDTTNDGNMTYAAKNYIECIDAVVTTQDPNRIFLAGIMDTSSNTWCPDIFEFTVGEINQGRWNILKGEERVEYELKNSNCDETTAARAYWDIRTENGNRPPDGIVGARCSGPSTLLAQFSNLQRVPHVSPVSTTHKLTLSEFPFFSRLVAPNNEEGEVGAMIALLRHFGWDRITILATDTQFAKDASTAFKESWTGPHDDSSGTWSGAVAHSDIIRLTTDGLVPQEAIDNVFEGIPKGHLGSRIIVLLAHDQHAFEILERAHLSGFQDDTIWVGPSTWVGRQPPRKYNLPSNPGYMGLTHFHNRNEYYQKFLSDFQLWQRNQGKVELQDLPPSAAETVDAIIAMTTAIAGVSPDQRRLGTPVVEHLRSLDIPGAISGRLRFTPDGSRRDPKYSFFSAQSISSNGDIDWVGHGSLRAEIGSMAPQKEGGDEVVCLFVPFGCNPEVIPGDTYPAPPILTEVPGWVMGATASISCLLVFVSIRYLVSKRKNDALLRELTAFRKNVVGMRTAECDCIPLVAKDEEEAGGLDQSLLGFDVAQWCWKESEFRMSEHDDSEVYGDPFYCWIKYSEDSNQRLEEAYSAGVKEVSPVEGYMVNLDSMKQTNIVSGGYQRDVIRVTEKSGLDLVLRLDGVKVGEPLPADLIGEPQMVLIEGDVVQISKQRDEDGWAFGTKLHHADEAAARELVTVAAGIKNDEVGASEDTDVNVFADTGWFQLDFTRVPTRQDLEALKSNIGDIGGLDPPSHWAPMKDRSVVQRHTLNSNDWEYVKVKKAFMSTLHPPKFKKKAEVIRIERIQNLPMLQSYIVKLQTICYRETGHDNDRVAQRKAVERFQRKWLWHGTNAEVVDKILAQGFNRSFCGKHATVYGKGAYFGRDASYSAYPLYSAPDNKGHQYMMACRVAVGEYCKGRKNAPTPDVRDHKSHSLYDSTVGLLGTDTMATPSIYVTYHDSQAYPDYVITFKTS